jgi:iron complex transport system substrate-binding protein
MPSMAHGSRFAKCCNKTAKGDLMFRRVVFVGVLALIGLLPPALPTHAQSGESVAVVSVESARALVEAGLAAFGELQPDVTFDVTFVPSDDDVMAQVSDADLVIYTDYGADLPIEFECGTISRPYVLLPDLGARYLASLDCGDYVAPKTEILLALLQLMTGPDGQQIAIDLGLLPVAVDVVDQGGVTVSVPQPVRRIVSAYGVATYYVYTTGGGPRLVAAGYVGLGGPAAQDAMRRVDPNFDAVFAAVSTLNQNEINIEEMAALQPDLVLASARTQWLDTVGELGIPILRFEGETPERLKDAMTLLGAVLGPDAAYRARMFNTYYDQTLESILAQTGLIADPARVYFSGTEPLRVASGDMYQTAMIEAAGAVSVSKELTGFWNDVNLEQVVLWNPDVIFVPTYGGATVEAITDSAEWAILDAVQAGRVYQLPRFISPWDTPVPDSILGITWMAETLYPDQVNLDCPVMARYFYRTFYDYSMTAEEAQDVCG